MNALEIAAVGLQLDTQRLQTVAHNVANVATPGFKRRVVVQAPFDSVLDATKLALAARGEHLDTRAGPVQSTGRALDLVLADSQFLLIRHPDGRTALTRDARLSVDNAGFLIAAGGWRVQGGTGDIRLPRGEAGVTVDASGRVLAGDSLMATLVLMVPAAGEPLISLGDGRVALDGGNTWQAVASGALRSGAFESSNVNGAREMVDLSTTARHAETMVRLIQGVDDALDKAIRRFGETT